MQMQCNPLGAYIETRLMNAFRPGWLPSLVVLLLFPGLIGLGFWQLARAEEKRQLLAEHQAQQLAAPITMTELKTLASPAYTRVVLRGYFDAQHSFLLDNRIRDGKAGVEVLQPFHDQASGLWLLLNRGWLPWPDRRITPTFDTPNSALQLQASVYVSLGEGLQLQAGPPADSWPRLISAVNPQTLWQQLGRNGFGHELRLQPGPGALRADWPVIAMSVDKHLGYAFQWFALATALLGLFVYFALHNARETRHESNHHPV